MAGEYEEPMAGDQVGALEGSAQLGRGTWKPAGTVFLYSISVFCTRGSHVPLSAIKTPYVSVKRGEWESKW